MIHVEPKQPDDDAWRDWVKLATDASDDLKEAGRQGLLPAIDEGFYKKQKATIWAFFNGKCAYCEARLTGNQHGDVEHFRPKKAVIRNDGKAVRDSRTGEAHQGYYWLAYDWHNLLPSCEICNGPATSAGGEPLGKRNYFPLADESRRAFGPDDDLSKEKPLLLHPYLDQPEKELIFDDLGLVAGTTERGKATVELLKLNREGLIDSRREESLKLKGLVVNYVALAVNGGQLQGYQQQLVGYRRGQLPFSGMARAFLMKVLGPLIDLLDSGRGTPPTGTPITGAGG
jgi:hypothetical protein